MLNAIHDMNYYLLEQNCEDELLLKLAADMYRIFKLGKFLRSICENYIEGNNFEIVNPKGKVKAQIVNHFKLLVPNSVDDYNYENYDLVENSRGTWEFVHKATFDTAQEELDLRLKAKKQYACIFA